MSRLREWASGIWIAEAPLRFFGVPFGARMTVVRHSDGSLLLRAKRRDLVFDAELGEAAPQAWSGDLEQLIVRGSRVMEEVEFFHPSSRTLVVADLCEHFGAQSPLSTRVLARLACMYEQPRMPPDWQWSLRDREAPRSSFERLFAWDFDRVILAHGQLFETAAKMRLEREYAWALA